MNRCNFEWCFTNWKSTQQQTRDEFTYEWDFGDGFKETGQAWTVWHFYAEQIPKTYEVKVTIIGGQDGKAVAVLAGKIEVTPAESKDLLFSDKTWAETLRVALALLAPILALVAGAKEKLLQLDFLAAVVAIFLMGFTANAIKDLLLQSSTSNTPKPAS